MLITASQVLLFNLTPCVLSSLRKTQSACVSGGQAGIDQTPSLGSLVCALHFSHSLSACLEGLPALLSFKKGDK